LKSNEHRKGFSSERSSEETAAAEDLGETSDADEEEEASGCRSMTCRMA
jgi:hypothetical protein